jgi:ABC-type antimicrobial peptide transport system permease subunit
LLPDSEGGAPSDSAAGILQGLVGSSLSGEAAIPENLFDQLPSYSRFNQLLGASSSLLSNINPPSYYAEFATASAARSFINDESCSQNALSCPASKPFQLGAFGSNSIGLKDLQNKFSRIFGIAGLIVIALAIVIMSSTVGRMLADGRRETAVFRAVGAKRIDISTIYAIYTVMLSVIIAVLSLIAGLAIASFIDHKYWRMFTAQAQLAFGGYDQALKFRLFSLDGKIWLISLVAIASGLLSMILPLLRNVRRSPIKDMRDE